MDKTLLGGLTPARFLKRYWHKKPLLIRAAIPGFRNLLSSAELFTLAGRDDCESRLITGSGKKWTLEHGPFPVSRLRKLPASRWTLLVQSLNTLLPAADALMRRFDFIPHARLDDLMVSYAAEQGGVGPHVDSYDVFLLQGEGRRRWRISTQRDLELDPRAPLKLLRNFRPEQEWILEAGDMLYLPPNIAHEGTALDECQTYSIGFRAPSAQEIGTQFLAFMQEHLALRGMYADPSLRAQSDPARIANAYIDQIEKMLKNVRWRRQDIEAFAGEYLSEPKPHIQFERPKRSLNLSAFVRALETRGLQLALPSIMLYRNNIFFLNGERYVAARSWQAFLRHLANERSLPAGTRPPTDFAVLLHEWYEAGYLQIPAR